MLKYNYAAKSDLSEIAKLIKPLEDKIEMQLGKVEERLNRLEAKMEDLEEEVKDIKEELTSTTFKIRVELKEEARRIKRSVTESQNVVIDFFDKELKRTNERIDRIEDHLKLLYRKASRPGLIYQ